MTLWEIFEYACQILQDAALPEPKTDARYLLTEILNIKPSELTIQRERILTLVERRRIESALKKRARFVPLAYILGYQYFYRDRFFVSPKCLIPRPDTEHILYVAESLKRSFSSILDIGTGSGALAISLSRLFPTSQITAIDIETSIAKKNIRRLSICNVTLQCQDVFTLKEFQQTFDLIVSNPPYLSESDMNNLAKDASLYEPKRAFYGHQDGLGFYRRIAEIARNALTADGVILIEIDHKWEKVSEIFIQAGFSRTNLTYDYNHLPRVLTIKKNGRP